MRWYARLGAGFHLRAARQEAELKRARFLDRLGRHFESWRVRHARLSRELRATPYLLVLPAPRRVM